MGECHDWLIMKLCSDQHVPASGGFDQWTQKLLKNYTIDKNLVCYIYIKLTVSMGYNYNV